jgi:hypothetical protein
MHVVIFLILGLHDRAFESIEISRNYYYYCQSEKHEMCVCEEYERMVKVNIICGFQWLWLLPI